MKNAIVRLGVVGLDGHGSVFIKETNSPSSDFGARVVAAQPIPSVMVTQEVLAKNVEETQNLGIEIVSDPKELASKVDGILILHDDGSKHLDIFGNYAEFGKPVFIDKPLEVSTAKALELVSLCKKYSCPVFSASALRFAPETIKAKNDETSGPVVLAMTYAPFMRHESMPGWIYYAIHAVEQLYALMGSGCKQVRCISDDSGAVAIGIWADGRSGIARAMSKGPHGYGLTVWREKAVYTSNIKIDAIYAGLLRSIVGFVKSGSSRVSLDESVEVIGFLEAANESMARGGSPVQVEN